MGQRAKLREKAGNAARVLAPAAQDKLVRAMFVPAALDLEPEDADAAQMPAVIEGLAGTGRGELFPDAEGAAVFRGFGQRGFA